MQLNLRKARKLEAKIKTWLSENEATLKAKVRVKQEPSKAMEVIEQTHQKACLELSDRAALIDARHQIRRLIGEANETQGINALMGHRELLKDMFSEYNGLISQDERLSAEELTDLLSSKSKQLDSGETSYRYMDTEITTKTGVFSKEDLDSFKERREELKKQIEDTEDQLSAKNLNTKITLDQNLVELLKANSLV